MRTGATKTLAYIYDDPAVRLPRPLLLLFGSYLLYTVSAATPHGKCPRRTKNASSKGARDRLSLRLREPRGKLVLGARARGRARYSIVLECNISSSASSAAAASTASAPRQARVGTATPDRNHAYQRSGPSSRLCRLPYGVVQARAKQRAVMQNQMAKQLHTRTGQERKAPHL